MIKLFKKLVQYHVQMYIDYPYHLDNENIVNVTFKHGHQKFTRYIDLFEFKNVWGGDHVLENVLERYLDEFLQECNAGRREMDAQLRER